MPKPCLLTGRVATMRALAAVVLARNQCSPDLLQAVSARGHSSQSCTCVSLCWLEEGLQATGLFSCQARLADMPSMSGCALTSLHLLRLLKVAACLQSARQAGADIIEVQRLPSAAPLAGCPRHAILYDDAFIL